MIEPGETWITDDPWLSQAIETQLAFMVMAKHIDINLALDLTQAARGLTIRRTLTRHADGTVTCTERPISGSWTAISFDRSPDT